MQKKDISNVFDILEKEFVNYKTTELLYQNNYQLLIAIVLSAQATDNSVNKITKELFKKIIFPQDTVKIGFTKLNNYIKTINYHNTKAKHIIEMSDKIIDKFNGKIPNNLEDLMSLPGVGRKTANLILSIAFNQSNIAVDTHVFRVSNRIGFVNAKNVLETERQLIKNIPMEKHKKINSLLIQFGRKYCKAINPKCKECPLKKYCKTFNTYNNNKQ